MLSLIADNIVAAWLVVFVHALADQNTNDVFAAR